MAPAYDRFFLMENELNQVHKTKKEYTKPLSNLIW